MNLTRGIGAGIIGGAMVALGAAAAVRRIGGGVRARTDPQLDPLLTPPGDLLHHRIETADGGAVHLVEHGRPSGRPVVLLHGVTLGWPVWDAVMRLLGPTHRCIAWDMRGHGESVAGHDGVSMEAAAADLAHVLERLDLHDALVVGHSMGGMVLCRAWLDHQAVRDRTAGIALVATSPRPVATPGLETGVGLAAMGVGAIFRAGLINGPRYAYPDNDLSAALVRIAFGERATGAMVDQVRRMLADLRPETATEAGHALVAHDVRGRLDEIKVPTVVVVGDKDLLTPPPHARRFLQDLPDAELDVLGGVGHQVMQEAPRELVDLILRLERRVTSHG